MRVVCGAYSERTSTTTTLGQRSHEGVWCGVVWCAKRIQWSGGVSQANFQSFQEIWVWEVLGRVFIESMEGPCLHLQYLRWAERTAPFLRAV